jgi:chitinase
MPVVNITETGKLIAPQAAKDSLPKHVLIGYWHNWHTDSAPFLRLTDVPDAFDVINVAFAVPSKAANGEIVFTPHGSVSVEEFRADVQHVQSLGKKVLLSIGGAAGSMSIEDMAIRHNFVDSISALIREYNFDGMDINLEGKVVLDEGDTDFRNPTSPGIVHLIMAIREIRHNFGPQFILSMAPETVNVQSALTLYKGLSGSYLPLIHHLRDILTWLQVQHYNSGPLAALDRNTYSPGTPDFHAAMAEMLLNGFPVMANPQNIFPPLKPEQVVIGAAAFPAAVTNGHTDPFELQNALASLASGESFGGTYVRQSAENYASLRGVMTWSINWDAANGRQFSNSIRSYFNNIL